MHEQTDRLRLTLEFEHGAEPIAGCVSDERGRYWAFTGWVQLATALEEALAGRTRDVRPPR